MVQPKSLSRGEVTELTHIAPIKRGVVPGSDPPISYADRLRLILRAFEQREDVHFPNVIRIFRGIHFAKWTLIDGDTRLLLNVTFDGGWDDYLRALTYEVPGFLHLIWSNCVAWEPVNNQPEVLFRFIRRCQVQTEFFYAQNWELTARDVETLKHLHKAVEMKVAQEGAFSADDYAEFLAEHEPKKREDRLEFAIHQWAKKAAARTGGQPNEIIRKVKRSFRKLLEPMYEEHEIEAAYTEAFGEQLPARRDCQ